MTEYAIVFPGQGSQKLGMMADLAAEHPEVHTIFSEASDALGYDLWQLCQEDEVKLNQTQYTQPAILTASVASWYLWQQRAEQEPSHLAGHSLGEYSALTCAGVFELADAVRVVAERGRLMQEAVPDGVGAMAAILGLEDEEVMNACEQVSKGQVVTAVNFNSPGQVVIAGDRPAVERACDALKAAGAKRAMLLPVSVPSHCVLMQPAADAMAEVLANTQMHSPRVPVIHNVDVKEHAEPDAIRNALVNQLVNPVRWVEVVEQLWKNGCEQLLECEPGRVLTGLNRRIIKAAECASITAKMNEVRSVSNG